jgi:hypothetical protein
MIGRRSNDDAQSFEDALNGATPRDEHVADLVRFAEGLCEAAAIEPSVAFRDSLRVQLMAEAATTLVAMPAEPRHEAPAPARARSMRRRIATATAALVAAGGGVGMIASSASAVPGDMLYPVKRTVESVELQLHRSDASRGSFQLDRAAERLAEARKLNVDGRSTHLITDTLDDFSSAAEDGSTRLFNEFAATGKETSIRKVNAFVSASSIDLSELSTRLPEGAEESFEAAKAAITDAASEASTLCKSCERADILPLIKTVKELTSKPDGVTPAPGRRDTPAGSTPTAPSQPGSSMAPAPVTSSSPAAPKPATSPAPVAPAPTPTPKAPSLTDITDPLLGGLLGNDEQVGLVPGLLGGLLGGGTPKP